MALTISTLIVEKLDREKKIKRIPRDSKDDYSKNIVEERVKWLNSETNSSFLHLSSYSQDMKQFAGNIENYIGVTQIPIGIAGPIKINGDHAKGEFYVPLATTEGALVTDYHIGMKVITRAGGVNATVLSNDIHISPVFMMKNINDAKDFITWVNKSFSDLKKEAEGTTRHGKLLKIEPFLVGHRVILKFHYNTKDAQGMNMINVATDAACKYIYSKTRRKYYLRSKFSSVKIVSSNNIFQGYGREVFVDGVIPRSLIQLLRTTPEELSAYYSSCLLVSARAGIVGMTAHIANGIAAIFTACGQDIADVSTSHIGISMCEVTNKGDLYISLYIPNLLIGTVGGGTGLGTQSECLKILDCFGSGKADKFAEIVASSCLAGELAILASIINGTFINTHQRLGRNRPK
jgi:hydroxymethylglutaryl-CoA reductase (NADPH)